MALMEINWNPDRGHLRSFGWICIVAFGALGTWTYFRHSLFTVSMADATARNLASAFWILAAVCGVLAATAPGLLRVLYVGMTAAAFPIGFVVSHLVFGILFYLVVTPVGLVMKLIGRDALCRKFDPSAATYWIRRPSTTDVRRYFRQF